MKKFIKTASCYLHDNRSEAILTKSELLTVTSVDHV